MRVAALGKSPRAKGARRKSPSGAGHPVPRPFDPVTPVSAIRVSLARLAELEAVSIPARLHLDEAGKRLAEALRYLSESSERPAVSH